MKHLIKNLEGKVFQSQCGKQLPKEQGTIWFSETDCLPCLDASKPKEIQWTASGLLLEKALHGLSGHSS